MIFVDFIWSVILFLPLIVLISYIIYIKRPNLGEVKPPSGYEVYTQPKAYARISPNSKNSTANLKLHKLMSLARPYLLGSAEGRNANVWVKMAVAAEKLGRVPESYTYYIEALRNGVPNPINSQIREKLGIPAVLNKAKYPYQRSPDQTIVETATISSLCPECNIIMIKEEGKLICPLCGKRVMK